MIHNKTAEWSKMSISQINQAMYRDHAKMN